MPVNNSPYPIFIQSTPFWGFVFYISRNFTVALLVPVNDVLGNFFVQSALFGGFYIPYFPVALPLTTCAGTCSPYV